MRIFTRLLLLLGLVISPMMVMSQVMVEQFGMETGVDSTKWVSLPEDTTITKTLIVRGGDSKASPVTNMGFNFMFGGVTYSQFSVNTDGNLRLGSEATSVGAYSTPFGYNLSENLPKINGMGCDGKMNSDGYVKYAVMGTAPSRVLVVEFKTAEYDYDVRVSELMWQVQLSETTNEVQLVYGSVAPTNTPADFQIGMASSETDVVTINTLDGTLRMGRTDLKSNVWPLPNTYYRFYEPACVRPGSITLNNVRTNSVDISWLTNEGQTTWQYACLEENAILDWTMGVTVNVSDVTINDLQPNTGYNVYVRTDCGADGYSDYAMINFHTECVSLSVPYRDGFEDYDEESIPNCWATTGGDSYVVVDGIYYPNSRTGHKSMELSDGDIILTPRVNLAANEMMLNVYVKASSSSAGPMEIGYVTNPTTMDFVAMRTVTPINDQYQEVSVNYNTLTITDTVYIAFKYDQDGYSVYHLDDIEICRASSCPRPSYAYVDGVTHNSAIVEWDVDESVSYYEVAYGVSDSLENATIQVVEVGGLNYTLTDLNPNTTYHAWVRNVCDVDSSQWRYAGSFTTKSNCAMVTNAMVSSVGYNTAALSWMIDDSYGEVATAVELSYARYSEDTWSAPIIIADHNYYYLQGLDFGTLYKARLRTCCSNDSSDYVQINFATQACVVNNVSTGIDDSYKVPFGGNYNYSYSQMLYPASELVGVDTILGVSFYVTSSEIDSRLVDVYMANVSQTTLTADNYVQMSNLEQKISNYMLPIESGWITIPFSSPFVYDGTSSLVIAVDDNTGNYRDAIHVRIHSNGSSLYKRNDYTNINPADTNLFLSTMSGAPDVQFMTPCSGDMTCMAPMVALENVTGNSIMLNWQAGANETQWIVEYKMSSVEEWTSEVVNTTTYTLSDLLGGTSYDIRVGSICASDTMFTMLHVFTNCTAVALPFVENFDDATIACWNYGAIGEDDFDITWDSEMLLLDFGYDGGYITTPELPVDVSALQASFSVGANSGWSSGALIVAAATDPNNMNTFVYIDTIVVAEGAPMSNELVSFNSYVGSARHIVFLSYGEIYLDNITIDVIPDCSMPTNLAVSNITSESATLSWVDDGTMVEKWIISYMGFGESHTTQIEVMADDGTTYDLTGLSSNTEYTVSVTTVCFNGDSNVTLHPVIFRTSCADIVVPFVEGFEGIASEDFHQCWYRDNPSNIESLDIDTWYIPVPSVYAGEGPDNTMAMSDNKKIISPRIAVPANQLSINFDMKFSDVEHSGKMVVGFTPDASSDSNMIVVDTIVGDTTLWKNHTVNFNHLTSTDTGYVVFKNVDNTPIWDDIDYTNYYSLIWIDNIDFNVYNSCVRPYGASIDNITTSSASISFSDSANASGYTVAWNMINDVATATMMETTTTTATINNLQANTNYYVWVRSKCSDTQYSAWTLVGSFNTECDAIAVPYTEDFDSYTYGIGMANNQPVEYPHHSMPNCWKFHGMSTTNIPFAMISNYPQHAVSGTNVLYAESGLTYLYMVMPEFAVPLDSLMLSFTYQNGETSGRSEEFVLGVMTDRYDTSTFVMLEDLFTSANSTHVEHIFALDEAINGTDNYYIALRFGDDNSYGESLVIDDVMVTYAPSCYRPSNIHLMNIASTTATIGWMGNASNYEILYRVDTNSSWTQVTSNINNISLTGLNNNTGYEMKIRGICGAQDSSLWSDVFNFRTMCGTVSVPWSENFNDYTVDVSYDYSRPESYPNHKLPDCWVFSEMSTSDYNGPAIWLSGLSNSSWSTYHCIDGIGLKMESDEDRNTYAILPAMDADIDTLALYFEYAMPSYADPMEIGVVTNPYDFSTYIQLETFPVFDSAHSAEHYFLYDNLDENEDYYIVFKAANTAGHSLVIDNIRVEYRPACLNPANIEIVDISNDTAKVKWDAPVSSVVLGYRIAGDSVWTSTIVNGDSTIMRGLTGYTSYEVSLKSICGNGDTSDWATPVSFTTLCSSYSLPFVENFNVINDFSELGCWMSFEGFMNDVISGVDSLASTELGSYGTWRFEDDVTEALASPHMYLNIYGSNSNDWIVTPRLDIPSSATLSFKMAFTEYGEITEAYNFDDDKFVILVTTDNCNTWTKIASWGNDSTDTYSLDSVSAEGDSVNISLDQFANQQIRIAFYGESTIGNGDNNMHIDDIRVEGVPCATPFNVAIAPEPLAAVLTWNGSGQNYEVALRENSNPTWPDPIAVTGTSYTFTDLLPETTYEYRLRQVCDANLYSEWVSGVFNTLVLPCEKPIVTVSDITGDGATFTWAQGENHTAWEVNVFNAMVNETYDVTSNTYAVVDLEPATEYSVAVRAKCAETIYSDWSDTMQFTTLDCLPVSNVAASEITSNSAKITWAAGGDEAEWIVNYGEMDFPQGGGVFETVSEPSLLITNLDENTDYDVYVRAVCGENFTSTWSTPVCQFKTKVGTPEGIDGIEGSFHFTIYPNPTSGSTTISLHGIEGKVTISVVDMNGRMVTSEIMNCGSDCEKRLDVTGLSQGSYFVRIVGDEINSVRKLIVR